MELLWLFLEFFKIGCVSFGGGYGVVPLVKESVSRMGWISEECFYDFIGVCESTPGPIAVNLATYVGTTVAGPLGALVATFGVILPPFIIILILAAIMTKFLSNKHVKAAFNGIQPTCIGLIVSAGLVMGYKTIVGSIGNLTLNLEALGIFIFVVITNYLYKVKANKNLSTIAIILLAGSLGLILGLL